MYEIRPDIFPYDHLTMDELQLWELFYDEREQQQRRKK